MKSDRRHDLSENTLAKWLTKTLGKISPYQNHIYWSIIALLAIVCVGMIWGKVSHSNRGKAWGDYLSAFESQKVDDLEALTQDYKSGEVGVRIRLSAGELLLREGCDLVFTKKQEAQEKLEKALGYFISAKEIGTSDRLLNEQTQFDLAQVYESLAFVRSGQNDLDNAKEFYGKLVTDFPDGAYFLQANRQLKLLNNPSTIQMVGHFEQLPTPSETTTTSGGGAGFDPTLPDPNEPFVFPEGLDAPSPGTTDSVE